jgi:hypothetical protein
MGDPETLEAQLHALARVGKALELPVEIEELSYPKAFGQRHVTRGEANLLHRTAPPLREAVTGDLDPALVGRHDTEKHEQCGGLARSVGTQERDALSRAEIEIDVVHGDVALKPLYETTGAQYLGHGSGA